MNIVEYWVCYKGYLHPENYKGNGDVITGSFTIDIDRNKYKGILFIEYIENYIKQKVENKNKGSICCEFSDIILLNIQKL